ncbi:MAG: FMN-dependent NADH-azoreductase [Haemophilus parainfluenzae]|nr:FMN-dependent NADH-azoreductase [Haemophilus parainfluenzae]
MTENKSQVTEQLAQIMEQIEAAKEQWLVDDEKGALLLLQAASREMKSVAWRMAPVLG